MKQLARRCAAVIRKPLLDAARATLQRPLLRRSASALLDRLPWLRSALRKVLRGPDWRPARPPYAPQTPHDLSPETQAAYRALQAAFARQVR